MDPDDPLAATETVPREEEETMDEEAEKEKKDDENGIVTIGRYPH